MEEVEEEEAEAEAEATVPIATVATTSAVAGVPEEGRPAVITPTPAAATTAVAPVDAAAAGAEALAANGTGVRSGKVVRNEGQRLNNGIGKENKPTPALKPPLIIIVMNKMEMSIMIHVSSHISNMMTRSEYRVQVHQDS